MSFAKKIQQKRIRREKRVRNAIRRAVGMPRLSVFRSNSFTYAQLIDDVTGKTLVQASSLEAKAKAKKLSAAEQVGKLIAERAIKAGITAVVFDRGSYRYHGRVKALADAARKGGLKF